MSYATQQQLIDRFGETELTQLTDRNNEGVIDDTVVTRALADADGEINAYLQTRYTLPLPTTPYIIMATACDIARYRLYDERASEQVTKRYNDAIKFLKAVADGSVSLGIDATGTPAVASGGPSYAGDERTFTRNTLSDFL